MFTIRYNKYKASPILMTFRYNRVVLKILGQRSEFFIGFAFLLRL